VHAVLRHRITLSPELEVEGRTVEEVVDTVVSRVAVPE
jgi:MoxR-like ATPase